jgi:hypothetical protein
VTLAETSDMLASGKRLMEGADIDQIAKNCRTSVEMIEKYYATHSKTRPHAAAINIMQARKNKQDSLSFAKSPMND